MNKQTASAVISSLISTSLIFLLLVMGLDASWRLYSAVVPVEAWLEVDAIHVNDSINGKCPQMRVERKIKKAFEGKWRVEVEKKIGALYVFRNSASGENSYSPDAKLPEKLDLGWWTFDVLCNGSEDARHVLIPKGVYRINTTWIIDPDHFPPKRLSINSNDFEVR